MAMMMNFAREVRIFFTRGLQDDFGAIGEVVTGEVDLAEGAFPDDFPKRKVPYMAQVL